MAYYYSYYNQENDDIHQIYIDDLGIPIDEKVIPVDDFPNEEMRVKLKGNSKLFIFGETVDPTEFLANSMTTPYPKPVYVYMNENISDFFDNFDEEIDWMDFFDSQDIVGEISRSPKKYTFH